MRVARALRSIADRFGGEPYERALADGVRRQYTRVVFYWNRGLGDIALGLVPMFARAAARLPHARRSRSSRAPSSPSRSA